MKTTIDTNRTVERYSPSADFGLTNSQVQCRIEDNLVNYDTSLPTKTIGQIIKENLVTLFNIINFVLALAIIAVGSFKNLLFLGVVMCNTIIGTYQEIRAKKIVDKLSIISTTKVSVLRNGTERSLGIDDIVLDDIVCLKQGNQVVTDCVVVEGECEVNESLLTGESDSIHKTCGDILLSGSFIVCGNCKVKVEHIGHENYASKISQDAKYIKKLNSEIMMTLRKIIKIISILIIPIGLLLFYNQFTIEGNTYQSAVVNTVAALIGMIPEGLVLLTSTVLAVSVIRLSKRKVLVQELYCIETLARVDVLCLDKTGTITEGCMEVKETIPYGDTAEQDIQSALNALASVIQDENPTFNAIRKKYTEPTSYSLEKVIPFSSEKKWSGAYFKNQGTFVIGAPEFILKDRVDEIKEQLETYTAENRVILLAHSFSAFKQEEQLPDDLSIMAFILMHDKLRVQAKETLNFFKEQGVAIKIISGDNVLTVANIAKNVGLKDADNYIDATTLKSYEEIKEAADRYSIFGRVSPEQKKQLILALKECGHTVAMTGDGVNDVLALKEADCSVAMASGSDAARNVSQLVLLNSCFDSMPKVVAEGRRSINNIQRSSSLFLVKTIFSTLLAVIFLFLNTPYPFMPIQMTLTSMFTIGIPSFILALEPNKDRIRGNFFLNIISKAIPGALTVVINILLVVLVTSLFGLNTEQASTLSVILTGYTGLMLLYNISIPFNRTRKILFTSMIIGFSVSIVAFRTIFSLAVITPVLLTILVFMLFVATAVFYFIYAVAKRLSSGK